MFINGGTLVSEDYKIENVWEKICLPSKHIYA